MTTTTDREALRVHVRWLIRRDLPEVLDIEDASFAWEAWAEGDFLHCLAQRDHIGMIAECNVGDAGEKVIGFMVYRLHKARLHIVNFAVAPQYRRQGVGAIMVAKLTSKLASHRRTRVTLECRETNLDALLFFRSRGFRATDVLRDHFDGEDGVAMAYTLPGADEDAPDEPFTCDEESYP